MNHLIVKKERLEIFGIRLAGLNVLTCIADLHATASGGLRDYVDLDF